MQLLCDRILRDGKIKPGGIVKVDNFLNHQIDIELMDEIGAEFYRLFKDDGINKILTVEASGIAVACMAARYFHVPVLFAKKVQTSNIDDGIYAAEVESYTHGRTYIVRVAKDYLTPSDRVLILDDFLAHGNATMGLMSLAKQAGAEVAGVGICIEKSFQRGGKLLRSMGIKLRSLAIVSLNDDGSVSLSNDVE